MEMQGQSSDPSSPAHSSELKPSRIESYVPLPSGGPVRRQDANGFWLFPTAQPRPPEPQMEMEEETSLWKLGRKP